MQLDFNNIVNIKINDIQMNLPSPAFRDSHFIQLYTKYRDIKHGDIIIDAGCYPGDFMIYAVQKGCNKCYSFEPSIKNKETIKSIINLNTGIDNSKFEIFNSALYKDNGNVLFYHNPINPDTSGVDANPKIPGACNLVNTITLDSFMIIEGLKEVNFLKMDVEGSELDIIEGAKESLKNKVIKYLAIAAYHVINGEQSHIKLRKIFDEYGYKTNIHYEDHLTLYAEC